MAVGSSSRRAKREELRQIKVKVRFAPEQLAPVDYTPTGTTKELLDWVGRSPVRAKRVLVQELAQESPRRHLVEPLHKILAAQDCSD